MAALLYRQPLILAMLIATILVSGVGTLATIRLQEDPRINTRAAVILIPVPGATAQRVETQVIEPLERELREISEVKNIIASARRGVGRVTVELAGSVTETEKVFSEVRDKVDEAAVHFPPEAMPPVFDDTRAPVAFTLIYALSWEPEFLAEKPGGQEDALLPMLARTANELAKRLRYVPGTELVRLFGAPEEEITVTADAMELGVLGLSTANIARQLQAADAKTSAGVGRGERTNVPMEVQGELSGLERIRQVPIVVSGGQSLRLGHIAQVSRGVTLPVGEAAYFQQKRCIFIAVRGSYALRVFGWAEGARHAVAAFQGTLPSNMQLEMVFDQTAFIRERLSDLLQNLLLSVSIVMLVVMGAMGWRAALAVGAAIPLTMFSAITLLNMLDIPLHQISIIGLIISLGLLIDNAIVVVDEVAMHIAEGHSAENAIRNKVVYLLPPLASSTFTTVLAFMPILLLPGNSGEFVSTMGVSVILALVCSLALALTGIAAVAGLLLGSARTDTRGRHWLRRGIRLDGASARMLTMVRYAVTRPWRMGVLCALPCLVGFALAPTLQNEFFPMADRNQLRLDVQLRNDATIHASKAAMATIETYVRTQPEVSDFFWCAGVNAPSVYYNMRMDEDDNPSFSQAIITTDDIADAQPLAARLQMELDSLVPQAMAVLQLFSQGPPTAAPIEVRLSGPSLHTLRQLGDTVRHILSQTEGVVQVSPTLAAGTPKAFLPVDEDQARLAGLTPSDAATQLQVNLEGSLGGSVLEQVETLPVRVRLSNSERALEQALQGQFAIQPGTSAAASLPWTPLVALAEQGAGYQLVPEAPSIPHYDGQRTNTIEAFVDVNTLPLEAQADFVRRLEASSFALPEGYSMSFGGENEQQGEAMGDLFRFIPLLGMLMVTTLILSFRSIRMAILLGSVAGLSVGTGLLATKAAGFPLSFMAILGVSGLIGIALNDAIVVVASLVHANIKTRADIQRIPEVVMTNARHVIATTLTTMGGFLPLILGTGTLWPPLATVIACGVLGATALAFFFTPAAYVLLLRRS